MKFLSVLFIKNELLNQYKSDYNANLQESMKM